MCSANGDIMINKPRKMVTFANAGALGSCMNGTCKLLTSSVDSFTICVVREVSAFANVTAKV
jgi:hypothetical protein